MGMFTRFRFINGTPNPAWAQIKISDASTDYWVPTAPLPANAQSYVEHVLATPRPLILQVDGYLFDTPPPPPPPYPPPGLTATLVAPTGDDFLEATVQAAYDGHNHLVGCLVGFTDGGVAMSMQMH